MLLRNNFEGGPDGTTITTGNSDQTGTQNAFDQVDSSGSGTILKYASSDLAALARPTAEYVMKMQTGAVATTPSVRWTSSMGNQTQVWMRWYTYFTSVGSNSSNLCVASLDAFDAAAVSVNLRNTSSPYCLFIRSNTGVSTYMTSTPITAGVWIRIEWRVTMSATNGNSNLYVYVDDDVDGTDYTDTIAQSGQNYSNSYADGVSLGQNLPGGGQANTPALYFSNWEVNNLGYPGPAPFRPGKGVPGILTNPVAIHTDCW